MQDGMAMEGASLRALAILGSLFLGILAACSLAWAWAVARWTMGQPVLPRRPHRPVSWGAGGVLFGFVAWIAASQGAGAWLAPLRDEDGELPLVAAMGAVSVVNLLLLVLIPLGLSVLSGASAADYGLRPATIGTDLAAGAWAALFLAPPVYCVQFLSVMVWTPELHPLQSMLFRDRSLGVAALAVASAVVLAPAAEELLFRGLFQGWLDRRVGLGGAATAGPIGIEPEGAPAAVSSAGWGAEGSPWEAPRTRPEGVAADPGAAPQREWSLPAVLALVVPAALFAAVHYPQWPAPIPLFLLALGLGVVYRRTGGLVAPIAMHATFNGLSTLVLIVAVQLGIGPEMVPAREEAPAMPGGVDAAAPGDSGTPTVPVASTPTDGIVESP